jgi:hypothetical protein
MRSSVPHRGIDSSGPTKCIHDNPRGTITGGVHPENSKPPGSDPMRQVMLKCSGDSGDLHVGKKPDTVTFTCPASCLPLKSITPDPPGKGFTKKSTSGGNISYHYDGSKILGDPISYQTSEKTMAGNGTGVIKN